MNNLSDINLVDGTFSIEEAGDILTNLLKSKIQYHKVKNFGSVERFGYKDATAEKRLPELKESLETLELQLTELNGSSQRIKIRSLISIELC